MAPRRSLTAQPYRRFRKSNTMAEKPIWRFFKVIRQEHLDQKMLMLPKMFASKYWNELSDIALLSVSKNRVWSVGLERERGNILLNNAFHEFAQHYSLGHGYWLVFKYMGNSNFKVHIFDKSSCKIDTDHTDEKQKTNHASDSSANPSTSTRKRKRKISHPQNVLVKYTSDCGFPTLRHFKSKNPYFNIKLTPSDLSSGCSYVSSKGYNYAELACKLVRLTEVKLQVPDGRQWNVSVHKRENGRMCLGKMKNFYEENELKQSDICIFELVTNDVFKVFLFSAT